MYPAGILILGAALVLFDLYLNWRDTRHGS